MQETMNMSQKEIDRMFILQKVCDRVLTQKKAAEILGLKSDRQVRNLVSQFKKEGAKGLISKKRGKSSNRTYSTDFKSNALKVINDNYKDFGPTLVTEKLGSKHEIRLSKETVRKWMIENHLWISRKKRLCLHPLRPRRDNFGELIQIDGSHHYWFENRAEKCVLIAFIDDATSRITSLHFCVSECLQGYFAALKMHLVKYGRPLCLYSDRHAIFGGSDKTHHAQFIRATKELGIESLLAHSPQAKGRVERLNQTLQDRLVKELRLRSISTLKDANEYLPEFIEEYNGKFSKEPRGQFDAHRPLDSGFDLERTLTRCETRTLSKGLSFSFNNTAYQILTTTMNHRLQNKKIEVRIKEDGSFKVFYLEMELKYVPLCEYIPEQKIVDIKEKLNWNPGRGGHPGENHPWKKYGFQLPLSNNLKRTYG